MAATSKIVAAVREALETAMPTVTLVSNVPEVESLPRGFGSAVNIRLVNVQTRPFEGQSQQAYSATLILECYAEASTTQTIDEINQATHAGIIAALWNDGDPTLDGMVDDLEPTESDLSEYDLADAGWAPLMFRVEWFTRRGDAAMIVGRGGVLF